MKKTILLILLALVPMFIFAQEGKETESKSKAVEFSKKDGTLLRKEFYDIGSVKGIEFQVLIMTDELSKEKLGALRIKTSYYSSVGTDDYVGTLDFDEIDACLKSLEYIQNTIITSTPATYTECGYSTKDNVEIGTYSSEKKGWVVYIQTKGYTTRSLKFVDLKEFPKVIKYITSAKSKIQELVN